jgi:hypothetical protein
MGPLRRTGAWLAAALLAVCLAALALLLARRPLAERWLLAELRRLGAPEATLAVTRVGPGVLEVRDVAVGRAADLVIDLVEARVTRESLLAGRLAALRVRGVRVRGAWGDQGLRFGALDALLAGGEPGAGAPLALPAASVAIEAGELTLETPRGPLRATFAASGSEGQGGRIEGHADLEAQHPLFTAQARLDAAGSAQELAGALVLELGVEGEVGSGASVSGTRLSARADLRLHDGALEIDATLPGFPLAVSLHRASGDPLLVRGEAPTLRIRGRGPPDPERFTLRVESEGGRLEARELDLEIRDVAVALDLESLASLPVGRVSAGRILDLARPERFAPLSLHGELRAEDGALGFDLTLGDGASLSVGAKGRHDPRSGAGAASVRLAPLAFEGEGLQPVALLPILGDRIRDASGAIEAVGDFSWREGAARGALDVALRDLSGSAELADVERANAALRVAWPLSTPPRQLLSLARLDCGLELTDGLVEFELRPDGVLVVPSATFEFAGGRVSTAGEFDRAAEERSFVLAVEDLDLGALFALVPLEGLSGEGTLSGEIPGVVRGEEVEIRGAFLASHEAGGWIRYRPGAGAAGLAANPGMAIALRALQNFAFEKLEVRVDGDALGPVVVTAALRGSNPDLEGGRPVEFNLSVEGELGDLVGAGLASYQIPEEIERRLGEFAERSR